MAIALAAPASGCFFTPAKPAATTDASGDGHGNPGDAGPDAPLGPAPVARKIASAWYAPEGTASGGMSPGGYSISTSGINNGDLVLFIANIDNGNQSTWQLPTAAFHQLAQINYGSDGQTFFAAFAIANNEPTTYAQSYVGNLNSAAATITLLAVSGADPAHPIEAAPYKIGSSPQEPAVLASDGVTTTAPGSLVVFAGGADWTVADSNATFTAPSGFDVLDAFCDRGGVTFQWTTQLVADRVYASPGPTGPTMGSIQGSASTLGTPWTLEIAIAPAPQ